MTNVASVAIPILPTISNSGVVDGASVFVLDDDENTLEATRLLLERWGCIVQTSQDWNRAADACFDVLICDYELSVNMSGIDVIRALQEAREDIGVIMISGNTSKELRSAADALAVTLLHKPLRPAQLRSALLNTLTRSDESARGRK